MLWNSKCWFLAAIVSGVAGKTVILGYVGAGPDNRLGAIRGGTSDMEQARFACCSSLSIPKAASANKLVSGAGVL